MLNRRFVLPLLAVIVTALGVGSLSASSALAADTITWGSSNEVVNQAPFSTRGEISGIDCPATTLCVAVTKAGVISTSPGVAGPWTTRAALRVNRFTDVSCATTTMCIAITDDGWVYGSSAPTTSAWNQVARPSARLAAVSCPTTTRCAAVSPVANMISASTNPLQTNSWTGINAGGVGRIDIECVVTADPSTVCRAISGTGSMAQSSNPANPAGWNYLGTFSAPVTFSCPAINQCVGLETTGDLALLLNGGVFTTSDRTQPADSGPGIDCPKVDFCLETTAAGIARRSLAPTVGGTFTDTTTHAAAMTAVACAPGTAQCAIGTADGRIISSTNAAATPSATWTTSSPLEQVNSLTDIDCASATACFTVDDRGRFSASATPTISAAWTTAQIDPSGRAASELDCPSATLCVVAYPDGDIATVSNPLGARTVAIRNVAPGASVTSVSCPTASLCVVGTSTGAVVTSTAPTTAAWTATAPLTASAISAVHCRAADACAAITADQKLYRSSNPAGGAATWELHGTINNLVYPVTALRCTSAETCLVGTAAGSVGRVQIVPWGSSWVQETITGLPYEEGRSAITDIECSVELVCVASTFHGATITWAPGWYNEFVWRSPPGVLVKYAGASLTGTACAGTSFCLTSDVTGQVRAGAINHFTLTVSRTGTGNGKVTDRRGAIDCGLVCTAQVPVGTVTVLEQQPNPASVWAGWVDCPSSFQACELEMSQDRTIGATFNKAPRSIGARTEGPGRISFSPDAGGDCSGSFAVCTRTYLYGNTITLTAKPDEHAGFLRWRGACADAEGPTCQLQLTQETDVALDVWADFAWDLVRFDATWQGPGSVSGHVFKSAYWSEGLTCTSVACGQYIPYESGVTLTAAPGPNAELVGWTGCEVVVALESLLCQTTVDQAKTATATFRLIQRALTVTKQGSGNVTSAPAGINCGEDCSGSFDHGQVVTLSAAPEGDAKFTGWGGACAGTAATCSVTLDAAKTVSAEFTQKTEPTPTPTPTPSPSGPTPGVAGPTSAPGAVAPLLSGMTLTPKSPVAGKPATFALTSSAAGTLKIVISQAAAGRKVAGACKPQTAKNKKAKSCKFDKTITTLTAPKPAGKITQIFTGKLGKKKLKPGSYKATVTVTGATGVVSKPVVVGFKVKRK